MPPQLLHFFAVAGRMLPAVGFAMLLKQSLSKNWMIVLFLMGWIIIGATSMTVTALAVFATGIAFLFVMAQGQSKPAPAAEKNEEDDCYEE